MNDDVVEVDEDGTVFDGDGERIEAVAKFTPTSSSGSVKVEFTFNARKMIYTDLVVFEELYFEDLPISQHTDIKDEDQTVHIAESGIADDLIENHSISSIKNSPKTGDTILIGLTLVAIITGGTAAAIGIRRRKQR